MRKEFTRYVTMNILGMLGLSCYILADTYFIAGWLGENGLASLNLAIPIYSLISGTGLMLGMGGGAKYIILKSCHETEQGSRTFTNTIYMGMIFSMLFITMGIFCSEQIAVLLGADENTLAMSSIYLKILLICSPFFLLNQILICFVRNDGDPKRTMTAMLSGSFMNIILDYVFIFILHGGMKGAVIATCFSPVISMGVILPYFIRKQNQFHFVKMFPEFRQIGHILTMGGASFITEITGGIIMIVFNLLIYRIAGNTGIASYGIVANISLVVTAIHTGIAQGVQPLISRETGKENSVNAFTFLKYALILTGILSIIIYLLLFVMASPISSAFNRDNHTELQKLAVQGIRLYFSGCGLAGMNIIISGYLASCEKPIQSNIISILRGMILMIPLSFLLSNAGLSGIWLTYPLTEFLTGIVSILFLFRQKRTP